MRKHCIVLSLLLLQSCSHCYVINPTSEHYELRNLPNQQSEYASRPDWQNTYMSAPEQARQNAWLKYLSEEFKRALNEDTTDTQVQPEMYMEKTPVVYAEEMMEREAGSMDMDRTKVKKSARMDMQRLPTDYPQSFNYINKQVDVRAPETVFVTFPEHTQIVDEYGRVIRPTTAYIQAPQRYMQEVEQQKTEMPEMNEESSQTEKKDNKKVAHKKSEEKHEDMNTTEQTQTDEKHMDVEQKETVRKTKTKHDKNDKRKKQTKTKHAQETETEMKSSEQSASQDKHTDTKHAEEEEDMTPNSYTQNQAKYKTPIESAHNVLLAKLNGPFVFGKNAI